MFLAMIFVSILLAGIAYRSSGALIEGNGETGGQGSGQDATETGTPVLDESKPVAQAPKQAVTPTATPIADGGETVAQATKQVTILIPTPISSGGETIAQAAKASLAGVAIVERGGVGAQAAERATIQAAIDAMMLDNLLAKVTANGTADYIRAKGLAATDTDFGRGQYITAYVRDAVTAYCYTWSSNGTILTQVVPGTAPCAATP